MSPALLVFFLLAQSPVEIDSNFLQPIVWQDTTIHHFGNLEKGKTGAHAFIFKNTGSTPITIDNVRTTCGCTATDWPVAPVGPGQTDSIRVTFDAYKKGTFEKRIRVFFSQMRKAEVLVIRGIVR